MQSRRNRSKKPPTLMLTSLLDMFTIILIFLIVSFEAEDYGFKLNPDLKLPSSQARSIFKPAVNMAVTPNAIMIEQTKIASLTDGRATEAEYNAGEIEPVVTDLKKRFEQLSNQESEDGEDPALILIQADKELDYKTLYLVMRSASVAGFVRYRLAIMKK
ncbi:MAG: biopolymer transporter ExbD [Myxococcota bacterium]